MKNGKPIFVPSELGRKIGVELKSKIGNSVQFEPFYYHLRSGGHVAALHEHRNSKYFARLDIKRFFYSVTRNKVARTLQRENVDRPIHYAKWSTVKNPYLAAGYVLPYGFVQSPILASLVLKNSALGQALTQVSNSLAVSVFVDDISISGQDRKMISDAYQILESAMVESGFEPNADKARLPAEEIDVFNCDLRNNFTAVQDNRIADFDQIERSIQSQAAFQRYCEQVTSGNTAQ